MEHFTRFGIYEQRQSQYSTVEVTPCPALAYVDGSDISRDFPYPVNKQGLTDAYYGEGLSGTGISLNSILVSKSTICGGQHLSPQVFLQARSLSLVLLDFEWSPDQLRKRNPFPFIATGVLV